MIENGRHLSVAVGKILAEQRIHLGLTQANVAKSLRIQRTSISNIESGKQVLLLDVFVALCDKLSLSPANVIETALAQISVTVPYAVPLTTPYDEIFNIVKG